MRFSRSLLLATLLVPSAALAASPHDETGAQLEAIEAELASINTQLEALSGHLEVLYASMSALELETTSISTETADLSDTLSDLSYDIAVHDKSMQARVNQVDSALDDLAEDHGTLADGQVDLAAGQGDLEDDHASIGFTLDSTRSSVSSIQLDLDDVAGAVVEEVEQLRLVQDSADFLGDDGALSTFVDVSLSCDEPFTVDNLYIDSSSTSLGVRVSSLYAGYLELADEIYDDSTYGTDVFMIAEPAVPAVSVPAATSLRFVLTPQGDYEADASYASGYAPESFGIYAMVRTRASAECELVAND